MQLRGALSIVALTVGVAHAQSIDPVPPGLGGPPPPAAPPSPGPATPAPDPSAPAAAPPPGAIAPPTDPDNLPPDALPLAIAPAEATVVVEPTYPRAFVDRPLVIPGGMLEASLAFIVTRTEMLDDKPFTSLGVSTDVGYAVGRFGLSAGADVILDVTPDVVMFAGQSFEFQDEQRLLAAYASARFAPTPDSSLRLQLVGQGLTTDVQRTITRLVGSYKARVAPRVAVVPAVSTGFARTTYDDVSRNIAESRTAFVAAGRLAVTAQVTPLIALVAHTGFDLRYEGAADPNAFVLMGDPGMQVRHDHGVHLLASLTPHVDLNAAALVAFSDAPTILQFALGFTARTH